jgi:hypothetical protein
MFAGPSPGTVLRRHGRRTSPSPTMPRGCPLSTTPPNLFLGLCGSCPTSSPPPARTHRGRLAGRHRGRAGALVQIENLVQGSQRKYTETPPLYVLLFYVFDVAILQNS